MIEQLAFAPRLLIASDFDGTLAEIVEDPDLATPLARSKTALEGLAGLQGTTVAIVSGRRRSQLTERFDDPGFILIGEHGIDHGEPTGPDTPPLTLARELVDAAARATPGAWVEHKARGVGFHYRAVPDPEQVLDDLRRSGGAIPGIQIMESKKILEFTDSPLNKGMALVALKESLGVDRVLFMGDDVTDETAFAALGESDVGVHVGSGPTLAGVIVPTPSALADLLETLLAARAGAFPTSSGLRQGPALT